jgi:hypothetical protein
MAKSKILLHICCANCAIYPWEQFQGEGIALRGYFYNPNIHPYQEYQQRLSTLKNLVEQENWETIYKDDYRLEEFLRQVVFREKDRCRYCYRIRLNATAQLACKEGFNGFSSTLLYSRYQTHDLIREVGEETAQTHGIPFVYRDFRPGWGEGLKKSKKLGLYRQKYCGCIFSEKERFPRQKR